MPPPSQRKSSSKPSGKPRVVVSPTHNVSKPERAKLYRAMAEQHFRTLQRISSNRGVARMRALYERASAEIAAKLRREVARGRAETMGAHQHRIALGLLRGGVNAMTKRLQGELGDVTREAQEESLNLTTDSIMKLAKDFDGAEVSLPTLEVGVFEGVTHKRRESLLRRHSTSFDNYGGRLVAKMEDEISQSMLQQETPGEAIDRVQQAMDGEWWQAERIVRTECLLGDTLVDAAMIRAVHRRSYQGPVVNVVTRNGREFTATPNHPMLTRRGWVGAGFLRESDYLICDARQKDASSFSNKNVATRPACISELFDSIATIGVCERHRSTKPDFHGDAGDGHIDAQFPNRVLIIGDFAAFREPLKELLFAKSAFSSSAFCARCLNLITYEGRCLCGGADWNAISLQASQNCRSRKVIRCPYTYRAFSVLVALNYLRSIYVRTKMQGALSPNDSIFVRLLSGALNSSFCDNYVYFPLWDSRRALDCRVATPSDIEFDRCSQIVWREWKGHVYNLSTQHGYFSISKGLCTGNTSFAFSSVANDGIIEAQEELPDMMKLWSEHVTTSGAPMDDRVGVDSMAMAWQVANPGEMFYCPASALTPAPNGETEVGPSLAGTEVEFPPLRPNGREVLLPFRLGWGVGPTWRWAGRRVPVV
jgi:hypothetical protein